MRKKAGMKTFFVMFLAFALAVQMGWTVFPQTVNAEEGETTAFDVEYSATELKHGDELTITVHMPENNGQALDAELQYDAEKLELVSKATGEGISGANGDSAISEAASLAGKIKLIAALSSVDTHFKGGKILEVTFKVKDTAELGSVELKFLVNDLIYSSRTEVEGQLAEHVITAIIPESTDITVTEDEPVIPDEPEVPSEPDEPEVPSEPDEPEVPSEPDEPEVPSEPETPDEPTVDVPKTADNTYQTIYFVLLIDVLGVAFIYWMSKRRNAYR